MSVSESGSPEQVSALYFNRVVSVQTRFFQIFRTKSTPFLPKVIPGTYTLNKNEPPCGDIYTSDATPAHNVASLLVYIKAYLPRPACPPPTMERTADKAPQLTVTSIMPDNNSREREASSPQGSLSFQRPASPQGFPNPHQSTSYRPPSPRLPPSPPPKPHSPLPSRTTIRQKALDDSRFDEYGRSTMSEEAATS